MMEVLNAKYFLVFTIISALELGRCQRAGVCGECDPSSCNPPEGSCLAGRVKDHCDCCFVCGRKEGERCDHPSLNSDTSFGTCGENLECRMRTDLDPEDDPQAICFCTNNQPMCGSDGVTYENKCQLTEERYRRRDGLRAVSREPCKSRPRIVSAPQNQRNSTGSYVAMLCETVGWPAPEISWTASKTGSESITLPGTYSPRIVVHSRSGSANGDVMSWCLITHLLTEDEGTYECIAQNSMGSTSASAQVHVVQ